MKYYYSIFNQNIEFQLPDNEELNRNFVLQFSLYETKEKNDLLLRKNGKLFLAN